MEHINIELFNLINASGSGDALAIKLAILLAKYVIYLIPLFLIIAWLGGDDEDKEAALKSVCVALISLGIAQIIILIYPHPRPFVMGVGRTFMHHAPDPSFPSDHMLVFCAIAFSYLMDRYYAVGVIIFLAGVAVGWARVYLGVHFPFDMFASVIVALAVVVATQPLWNKAGKALTRPTIALHEKLFGACIKRGWIK